MLVSQMSSLSSTPILVLQASSASLRSAALIRRSAYQVQQSRGFQFGLWSSYLDPDYQKELQRRHRVVKQKYLAALNRKLLWDRHRHSSHPHWTVRNAVFRAWGNHDPRPGGRWINMDELEHTKREDECGKKKDIDELEQSAVDSMGRLFGRHNTRLVEDFVKQYRGSSGRVWNIETTSSFSTTAPITETSKTANPQETPAGAAEDSYSEADYVIDPISNRKVLKKTKDAPQNQATESSMKTFQGYRSQFSNFEPPKNEEEKKNSTASSVAKDGLGKYDSTHSYEKPHYFNEHLEGQLQESASDQGLAEHDKHMNYSKPHYFNEHLDGQLPQKPDPVQEALADYDKTVDYSQPHYFNEHLDGQLSKEADPNSAAFSEYDSTRSYDKGHRFNEHADGKISNVSESQEPKSRDRNREYQPIFYNHPDGYGAQKSEEILSSDQEKGLGFLTRMRKRWIPETENRDDVDLLRTSDVRASSGIMKRANKANEISRQERRSKLNADFNEATKVFADNLEVSHSTLLNLKAHARSRVADHLDKGKERIKTQKLAGELKTEQGELSKLSAYARERVDTKIAELEAEPATETSTQPSSQKLTGNFVRDFPEEFATKWKTEGSSYSLAKENEVQGAENSYAAELSSQVWQSPSSKTTRLETSLDRKNNRAIEKSSVLSKSSEDSTEISADTSKVQEGVKPLFSSSYGCGPDRDAKIKVPINEEKENEKKLVREVRDIYEDRYGVIDCQHRQVLEENGFNPAISTSDAPLLVAKPAGVAETVKYTPELSKATTKSHEMSKADSEAGTVSTTLYKILAYDPTMQAIDVAETTSVVPDTSGPLSPAEVLLRLAQPAKFFPHFKPLQNQGYEIFSGSGDVLIFRKVHQGSPAIKFAEKQDSARISKHTRGGRPINPVDGMNYMPPPASHMYANATGFVGDPYAAWHEEPAEEPKFKSNIDVRREEDVYSGKGSGWQESKKKPRGAVKKFFIGAAWVAGCSYAVGVVAEFLRAGGS